MSTPDPRDARLVIFDLDGVIYRGHEAIPGAAALVNALHADGRAVRFATNNSMVKRQDYVPRLAGHGIETSPDEIVTSSSATVNHIRSHLPEVQRVLAVGANGLVEELRDAGLDAIAAQDGAPASWNGGPLPHAYDAVVAGLDQEIDYRRLGIAGAAIRAGARFIATNADVRYPTPDGFVPGAGTIVAALEATSSTKAVVIGKPQPAMFQAILEHAALSAADALVVGDNPDADIVAARRAGVASVLVLTGIADQHVADSLEGERRPDFVVADPAELATLLGVRLS
jgi:phosphoglycolate/pyridoxal phosphate phosphatase family enzyme